MLYRWFVSIMSTLLVACAGPVRESVSRAESRASAEERMESRPAPTRKAATATATTRKPPPAAQRDAKASFSAAPELEEATSGADAFAGVDTEAPTDSTTEQTQQAVAVKGIEGTMSEYDVRTTLESRDPDFDHCHDVGGGGGGKIQFRIHILANGDVGDVKVHRLSGHGGKIVDCYTEVVSTSHFSAPHGGYADVKWTTKVGRSRGRPDATFERRGRWDTPATGGDAHSSESSTSRRERRHARRHRKGV